MLGNQIEILERSKRLLQDLGQIRSSVLLTCPDLGSALFCYKLMYAMHSMMFLYRFCMVGQAKNRTENYEHHQTIRKHCLGNVDS